MHNVATIYRFNTPFLNLENEKRDLLSVIKKIEKSLEFDGIGLKKESKQIGNYHIIKLVFQEGLGKVYFYYISDIGSNIYHLPLFKLDIYLNSKFLLSNTLREKSVKFLNNIFECFDGMNEKEYLIDLDNNFYYKSGIFKTKRYPYHNFSNIDKIKNDFESKSGMQQLKDFIVKFQNKKYILTNNNSEEYHKLHGILLYFIYLVYLVDRSIKLSIKTTKNLGDIDAGNLYDGQILLMKERLSYVSEVNKNTLERYKNRLELFFKMF